MPLTPALRLWPGNPFPLALHCRSQRPPLPLQGAQQLQSVEDPHLSPRPCSAVVRCFDITRPSAPQGAPLFLHPIPFRNTQNPRPIKTKTKIFKTPKTASLLWGTSGGATLRPPKRGWLPYRRALCSEWFYLSVWFF
jgi:hypothetical protein